MPYDKEEKRDSLPAASGPLLHSEKNNGKALKKNPERNYGVRKRKCQRMSTEAWTMAEAKIEPVLRQVQP